MALIPTWGQSGKGRQIKALPAVHTEMAEMKDKNRLRSGGEEGKRRNLNAERSRAKYRVNKAGVMECEEVNSRDRACGRVSRFAERHCGRGGCEPADLEETHRIRHPRVSG